jgi:hypothetical protein
VGDRGRIRAAGVRRLGWRARQGRRHAQVGGIFFASCVTLGVVSDEMTVGAWWMRSDVIEVPAELARCLGIVRICSVIVLE